MGIDSGRRCELPPIEGHPWCAEHIEAVADQIQIDFTTARGIQESVASATIAFLRGHISAMSLNAISMAASTAGKQVNRAREEADDERDRALREAEAAASAGDPIARLRALGIFR